MAYTNSRLVSYTCKSPNHSGTRNHTIDTISPHCMAGELSVESCGNLFAQAGREASSNYGIGTDGRIALYVDEKNRSWCTSSSANDNRAVTIEVASKSYDPYAITDAAMNSLIELMADICKRNGIKKLVWSTNKNDRINHRNGCNVTVHRDYSAKACPGDYIYNRLGDICDKVNAKLGVSGSTSSGSSTSNATSSFKVGDIVTFNGTTHYKSASASSGSSCKGGQATITSIAKGKAHPYHLIAVKGGGSTVYGWVNEKDISMGSTSSGSTSSSFTPYKVRITADELNIRSAPSTSALITGSITDQGVYTIVGESNGTGASKWGKLKSGAGWISLDYAQKV